MQAWSLLLWPTGWIEVKVFKF